MLSKVSSPARTATAMATYCSASRPAWITASLAQNPDSGGIPARLSAGTRNSPASTGRERRRPPVRESTLVINEQFALTATVDILRATASGEGPDRWIFALGYAGWGAGQLDSEMQGNGWLVAPADEADDAIVADSGNRRVQLAGQAGFRHAGHTHQITAVSLHPVDLPASFQSGSLGSAVCPTPEREIDTHRLRRRNQPLT